MAKHTTAITDELMKGIKAKGTETKDLSKLFSSRIVGVRLIAGRGRMQVLASDTALGITKKATGEAANFKKKNIKSGSFLLFNEEVIAGFDNLFANIRQAMMRYSISKEGSTYYMTSENYMKFKDTFENAYIPKFNTKKENLLASLDTHKKAFKDSLTTWLEEVVEDPKEQKKLLTHYVSKFPTTIEIEKDCQISLLLSAFPVVQESTLTGVPSALVKEIESSSEETSVDTLYQMILSNLEEAFKVIEKAVESIDVVTEFDEDRVLNIKMGSRTKGLLNQTIDYLENNNFVLMNDFISSVVFLMKRTFIQQINVSGKPITNAEALGISENLLALIYGYAKHIEMEDEFENDVLRNSDYDAETLEVISDMLDITKL